MGAIFCGAAWALASMALASLVEGAITLAVEALAVLRCSRGRRGWVFPARVCCDNQWGAGV